LYGYSSVVNPREHKIGQRLNDKKIGRHKGKIYVKILSLSFPFLSHNNSLMHSRNLGNN